MSILVPSNCNRCGFKGEAFLSRSGPHIVKRCGGCGNYVKFISALALPDLATVKWEAWMLAGKNENVINEMASELELPPKDCRTYLDYWRLYRELKERIEA